MVNCLRKEAHMPHRSAEKHFQAKKNSLSEAMIIQAGWFKVAIIFPWKKSMTFHLNKF